MENQDFLTQLKEQTRKDKKTLKELKAQQENTKRQIQFLEKRIKQSTEMLALGGESPEATEV